MCPFGIGGTDIQMETMPGVETWGMRTRSLGEGREMNGREGGFRTRRTGGAPRRRSGRRSGGHRGSRGAGPPAWRPGTRLAGARGGGGPASDGKRVGGSRRRTALAALKVHRCGGRWVEFEEEEGGPKDKGYGYSQPATSPPPSRGLGCSQPEARPWGWRAAPSSRSGGASGGTAAPLGTRGTKLHNLGDWSDRAPSGFF